jgi:phosphatidylglycerophosphate synthase
MFALKMLADALTALRFMLAVFIVWSAWFRAPEEIVGTLVLLTIMAWTTDWLDGPLACRVAIARQTWLGALDLEADFFLVLSLAVAMVVWAKVPVLFLGGALTVGIMGWLIIHSVAFLQLLMGLIYGTFILVVWQHNPFWSNALVLWIVVSVILHPKRAWQRISDFLRASQQVFTGSEGASLNGKRIE